MLRNLTLGAVAALAVTMVVCPGCSSGEGGGGGAGGDGGGDGSNAVSFDGETSVPATGGAAIAVDYSTGFARVLSSMLSALAIDAASETDSASLKFLDNVELPICDNAGGAILNGELAEGTASLTLTNCTGSPLSGTAVNGRLLLTFNWTAATVPGTTNLLHSLEGTAELAGLTDAEGDVFTIAPSTELTGRSAMNAEVVTTATLQAISAQITLGQLASDDRITVVERAGAGARMEFTCFEVSTDLMIDPPPPSIAIVEAQGVLSLEGQYYTLSSDGIGFPALSGGPAVPTSGSLTLTSGESGTCVEGAHPGDTSTATATFAEGGSVTIDATGADGAKYECTEAWANLLEALTDLTAFESCPCVTGCGGGTGGTAGAGGATGTGGAAGAGGRSPITHSPMTDCAGGKYDPDNNLCWEDPPQTVIDDLAQAIDHCSGLDGNWRVPTISELRSLFRGGDDTDCTMVEWDMDWTEVATGYCGVWDGCLSLSSCHSGEYCYLGDGCTTPGPGAGGCYWDAALSGTCRWYWSASEVTGETRYGWGVHFALGSVTNTRTDFRNGVRCVRTGP
ncbi:MAG: DUF1566 domain-containing protein [Deltaproteobacteria bacterium]|nr:DUF1566 domain-containing protein [Deltaproteobacteria bacterium]